MSDFYAIITRKSLFTSWQVNKSNYCKCTLDICACWKNAMKFVNSVYAGVYVINLFYVSFCWNTCCMNYDTLETNLDSTTLMLHDRRIVNKSLCETQPLVSALNMNENKCDAVTVLQSVSYPLIFVDILTKLFTGKQHICCTLLFIHSFCYGFPLNRNKTNMSLLNDLWVHCET